MPHEINAVPSRHVEVNTTQRVLETQDYEAGETEDNYDLLGRRCYSSEMDE